LALLFDQNVSPALVRRVGDVFPSAAHVRDFGLHNETDRRVWDFAREKNFCIVTKDSDFQEFSAMWGAPPMKPIGT
jgi:predicted nuclease of predicted toxin-antitoxin system